MQHIVPVRFLPGTQWVCVRELCGKDEMSVTGTKSLDAIRLLDGLLNNEYPSGNGHVQAKNLTVADRDRILGVIYQNTFGNKIYTTTICSNCDQQFDVDFELEALISSLHTESNLQYSVQDAVCVFSVNDKIQFRLPTGVDDIAICGMNRQDAHSELLSRCVLKGNLDQSLETIEQAMETVAPLIDHTFSASCPDCEQTQDLHFNLQQYLLSTLLQEKKKLAFEVHALATAYSWGLNEILELPRAQRHAYVNILDADYKS
jgi:hypothetical protein